MRLEETFSTTGTRRTSKPSRSSRSRSPSRPRPKRNVSPAATISAPIPRRIRSANSSAESAASSSSNGSTSDVLDSRLLEQLEPPLERGEKLDPPPSTARGCGSNVTTVVRSPALRAASITRR